MASTSRSLPPSTKSSSLEASSGNEVGCSRAIVNLRIIVSRQRTSSGVASAAVFLLKLGKPRQ